VNTPPPFDAERFRRLSQSRRLALGEPLVARRITASTNDLALAAAHEGAPHGATFVADEQTAGRGRRGNRWSSAPGADLTCSIVLRPRLAGERASALTLAIGLAVRDAAQDRTKTPLAVKWPNDVVAGRAKLAGILVESKLQGSKLAAVVAGIGLNVATREFPDELRGAATSLALLGAADLDRETLLADLLERLDTRVRAFETSGLFALLDDLRRHDALLERPICVDGVPGVARGIDESGALLFDEGSGVKRVLAGHVTFTP